MNTEAETVVNATTLRDMDPGDWGFWFHRRARPGRQVTRHPFMRTLDRGRIGYVYTNGAHHSNVNLNADVIPANGPDDDPQDALQRVTRLATPRPVAGLRFRYSVIDGEHHTVTIVTLDPNVDTQHEGDHVFGIEDGQHSVGWYGTWESLLNHHEIEVLNADEVGAHDPGLLQRRRS